MQLYPFTSKLMIPRLNDQNDISRPARMMHMIRERKSRIMENTGHLIQMGMYGNRGFTDGLNRSKMDRK